MTAKRPAKQKKKASRAKATKQTVTDKEPAEKKERFDVEFYRAWCKGCGICAAFCPAGALSLSEKGEPQITKPELCSGCTWCEMRCPDFAISVRKKQTGTA
jgi:2-oxoglutarate ferredoxin oxidoreductase subunit delta